MKTFNKNMSIIIGDGYRDESSLLSIKSNDSKDVIKDLISVLPNVLVLNVSDLDEPLQFHRYETCLRHFLPEKVRYRDICGRHERNFRKADASDRMYTDS